MRAKAFQGLVPDPPWASEVAAVPYDVVSTEEARALAADRPRNLLHVDRAEIDLPPETDPYSPEVYARARENFEGLVREGVLRREAGPCVYIYRQLWGAHEQTGVALACHVDDYAEDIIRKHEKTRPVKEDDRTRLVETLSAHTGPIFLTYRGREEIDRLVAEASGAEPLYDFRDETGVRHVVWRVAAPQELVDAFGRVPLAYVADGHHRSASAFRVGMERRRANPAHTGLEDYNWFLGVLFPGAQLKILPYHRVVRDLCGRSAGELRERLEEVAGRVSEGNSEPSGPGRFCLYAGGRWSEHAWNEAPPADPVRSLDVSLLQERVLEPLLGVGDPRTDERIDFIGGIRGTAELERRVDGGAWGAAFSLYPVTVDQLMEIADAGQIMPPKSTWFEPKLRSGLFIYTF